MRAPQPLALALHLNWYGVGYVVFEKPLTLFDWGVKEGRGKDGSLPLLRGVSKLLTLYRPAVVVLEDWRDRERPRSARIEGQYRAILAICERMDIPVKCVPMSAVRRAFAPYGATNKEEIAQVIAKRIPALSYHLPPKRKIWKPEPPRQAMYDAAALGLTFFQRSMHGSL